MNASSYKKDWFPKTNIYKPFEVNRGGFGIGKKE